MSDEKPNKRLYDARVEFWAVRQEVEAMLAEGHRAKPIYERLVTAGRLRISYTSFCDYLRGKGERQHGRKKSPPPAEAKRPPFRPNSPPAKSEGFVHDSNPDLSKLL